MTEDKQRRFNYCYLCLPFLTRLRIAFKYNLIREEDDRIDALTRNKAFVKRACDSTDFEYICNDVNMLYEAHQLTKKLTEIT